MTPGEAPGVAFTKDTRGRMQTQIWPWAPRRFDRAGQPRLVLALAATAGLPALMAAPAAGWQRPGPGRHPAHQESTGQQAWGIGCSEAAYVATAAQALQAEPMMWRAHGTSPL